MFFCHIVRVTCIYVKFVKRKRKKNTRLKFLVNIPLTTSPISQIEIRDHFDVIEKTTNTQILAANSIKSRAKTRKPNICIYWMSVSYLAKQKICYRVFKTFLDLIRIALTHCVKSVCIRSYSSPYFPEFQHFSRSDWFRNSSKPKLFLKQWNEFSDNENAEVIEHVSMR